MYDLRLKNPSAIIAAGPSSCGKTTWAINMLRRVDDIFTDPRCAKNVFFFYNQWQESYDEVNKLNLVTSWINAVPTIEGVKDMCTMHKNSGGSIILIDDFQSVLTRDVQDLFTVLSHQLNITVILLCQSLFSKNKFFRELSLNATYVLLFKSPRDQLQIAYFARQFSPGNTAYVIQAYREATKEPYAYMLYDMHQTTPDIIRMRSNILENIPRVWIKKEV